ncbi:MAG: hypothetical protein QM490_01910 [Candidatus Gracilibacteria bacterium]
MEAKNTVYQDEKTLSNTLKTLLGTFLGLIGFFLLIFFYEENSNSYHNLVSSLFNKELVFNNVELIFNMTHKYFSDIRDFAIQTSIYINKVGFTFSNFLTVYKTFVMSFSSLFPMLMIYLGLYIKAEGTVIRRILKITVSPMLIFGSAILISIALQN